jgi:WD40 repeat protein
MLIAMGSLVLLVVCAVPIWGFGLWSAWADNSHAQPPVVARLDPGGQGASETAWSPDGRYLAEQVTLAGGAAVVLWDVQTRQEVRRFAGMTGGLAASWSPDGAWLATTDGSATLLWRATEIEAAGTSVTPVARLQAPDKNEAITDLAWGQDGLTLAVVDEGGLEIWQQASRAGWKQMKYVQDGACATILCGRRLLRSPDGHWLLVAPWHGKDGASGVGVWDMQTWGEESLLDASGALAWSPDSSLVVVRNADETTLSAVRVGGWQADWTINPNKDVHQSYRVYPQAAGWSPDGEWLVCSMDGWVDLWPTDTQQSAWVWQEQAPDQGVYVVTSLAWSPDGRMLAVTTDGLARVTLYDLRNPTPPASGPPGF